MISHKRSQKCHALHNHFTALLPDARQPHARRQTATACPLADDQERLTVSCVVYL